MNKIAKSILMLLILLLPIISVYGQATSWVIVERSGEWEKVEPEHLETKMNNQDATITFQASNIKLGYYRTTFVIDLSGSGIIYGELLFEIKELKFTIKYCEYYKPSFLGISDYINNTLYVRADEYEYHLSNDANSPLDSRLNTRLYIWIWRSSEEEVSWIISDGYIQKDGFGNIYLNGTLPYHGEELSFTLMARKHVKSGEGKLNAYLIYNEIDSSGNVFEDFELSTLDYGFNSLFYASLSFFIVVITGQLLHKILLREMKIETEVKETRKKVKRKKR